MTEREWIIESISIIAWRVTLFPGEVLVATQNGRLVIVDSEPVLRGLCVIRTGDDGSEVTLGEVRSKLEKHCFANIE